MAGERLSRRLLQLAVLVLALVPVSAGLHGIYQGVAGDIDLDSHHRYLSGLLLAIGLAFWSCVPAIETKTARFRLLTFIVFAGGLARLAAALLNGLPSGPMIFGLVMELAVVPLLCLWQARIARP